MADLYAKLQAAVEKLEQRCDFVPGSINVQYSAKQGLAGILFQTPSRIISPSFAWNAQSAAQLSDLEPEQMETQLGLDYVLVLLVKRWTIWLLEFATIKINLIRSAWSRSTLI